MLKSRFEGHTTVVQASSGIGWRMTRLVVHDPKSGVLTLCKMGPVTWAGHWLCRGEFFKDNSEPSDPVDSRCAAEIFS